MRLDFGGALIVFISDCNDEFVDNFDDALELCRDAELKSSEFGVNTLA